MPDEPPPPTRDGESELERLRERVEQLDRAEEELARAKRSLDDAQRVAGSGSWDWSPETSEVWWSEGLFRIYGRDPALGPANDEVSSRVHPDDLPAVEAAVAASLRTGTYEATYRFRRFGDDEVRLLRAEGVAETDEEGQLTRHCGVIVDITEEGRAAAERARLEARLQQAQKLESLAVLAGGVAHDFNNILVAILGNAALAKMDVPVDSPVQTSLTRIEEAAHRAAELAGQMLAYSGSSSFVLEPVDLNAVIWDMSHLLDAAVPRRVSIRLDLATRLPTISADAAQMRQVVLNLVTNAAEALGDDSGIVAVRTGVVEADRDMLSTVHVDDDLRPGAYVYVEVTDTGPGMDADARAKLFDPFFSTKFTGRGLGLSAVLGIVRGLHGVVVVESEPGQGATFRALLPAATGPAGASAGRSPSVAPAAGHRHGKGTVLVVDDEEEVRYVARQMLERMGYGVLVADDGQQGLDLFLERGEEISMVLLDLKMPRLDGEQALVGIRQARPGARVVLMSGYSEQEATARFAGLALSGFLQKPFDREALARAIEGALR